MAWFEDGIDEVHEAISKENFETWYEEIIGEPISLTRGQWHMVANSLEKAIDEALNEASQGIIFSIEQDNYFDGDEIE